MNLIMPIHTPFGLGDVASLLLPIPDYFAEHNAKQTAATDLVLFVLGKVNSLVSALCDLALLFVG